MSDDPGRNCPLHYRYRASDLAVPPHACCDVLYVVGGLYGNAQALQRVLELFDAEHGDKRLVFNGDFHWFDVDAGVFAQVQRGVLGFDATRGNVETELAAPASVYGSDAGCGCAYPDWVSGSVVKRSNRILARLRNTARAVPGACDALQALPMWRRIDVNDCRVAIVHGDAQSLSGWGFAQESLREAAARHVAARWFAQAQVDVFASSHTCLPVWHALGDGWLLNNGAAGMPNFAGAREGLLTRIASRPFHGAQRRFGVTRGALHLDAIAIDYDDAAWQRSFVAQWAPGSDAHASYASRIADGPDYHLADALRTAPVPMEC
jgi:predicted phosphodiesterase